MENKRIRRDRKNISTVNTGEGTTEQAHAEQCDINSILHDYTRTGFMRHARTNEGRYDDVTATDFQEAAITVANVKSLFEGLPSQIRQEFNQDPASFLNFAQDPNNGQELSERGLLIGNDGIDMHGSIVNSMTKMQYQTMLNEKSKIDSEPRSEAILDSPKD